MRRSALVNNPLPLGLMVGLAFGAANLLMTWMYPVADDTDWQNMLGRFQASGVDSLRTFVNVDYIKGAPLKIAVASAIGAFMGVVGGFVGRLCPRLCLLTFDL